MNELNHKCPRCGLAGDSDLFEPDWIDDLEQLCAKASGVGLPRDLSDYGWLDKRRLLNFLRREVRDRGEG